MADTADVTAELRELKAAEHDARKKLDRAAAAYNGALDEHATAWWNRIVAERGIVTPGQGRAVTGGRPPSATEGDAT